jgi:hypothetical protein
MPTIKDLAYNTYTLTASRLKEKGNSCKRYVLLSDLKRELPEVGEKNPPGPGYDGIYPEILRTGTEVGGTWITVASNGRLSIGCKDFGVEASCAIYKAMGVKRAVR